MKTTAEKVTEILMEQLAVDENECLPQASLQDDLGADSLDLVELMMQVEEEFDLEIPDEEAEQLKTVGDVVKYLDRNIKPLTKPLPAG